MNRRQFTALCLLSVAAACGSDSPAAPEIDVTGTYALTNINASPLPYSLGQTQAGGTLVLVSGSVIVNANATFSTTFAYRETNGTTVTNTTDGGTGTWTRSNLTVTFRDAADGTTSSALANTGTLSMLHGTLTFVYRK